MADQLVNFTNTGPLSVNVDAVHPAVEKMRKRWTMIRDCIEGEEAVKKAGTAYLPRPNRGDESEDNRLRYDAYKLRASFYNVTGRTLTGLIGQAFALDPTIKLPSRMENMEDNVDGSGIDLISQAQQTTTSVLGYGRAGLFTDYPDVDGPVSVKDQMDGNVQPNIILYSPFSIINYRTRVVNNKEKLSLVVLAENYPCTDDGFEIKTEDQWRVLRLNDKNIYTMEIYRRQPNESYVKDSQQPVTESSDNGPIVLYKAAFAPTDSSGKPFDEIPFVFVGSMNNSTAPDNPPMYDLAAVNLGHYRNSADFEEACYMVGQPTPWVSGITQKWREEVFKNKTLYLGSRAIIPLPPDGQAGLLQVNPNSMPKEAMDMKEKQMVALGAKLVEPSSVQRTLGEARMEEATEASVLVTCVKNVAKAYKKALGWAAKFQGADPKDIEFSISTDFAISRLEPNERVALLNEWVQGGITTSEYRLQLRKAGIASGKNDDQITKPEPPTTTTDGTKPSNVTKPATPAIPTE